MNISDKNKIEKFFVVSVDFWGLIYLCRNLLIFKYN